MPAVGQSAGAVVSACGSFNGNGNYGNYGNYDNDNNGGGIALGRNCVSRRLLSSAGAVLRLARERKWHISCEKRES